MALKSKLRSARRLLPLATALLFAALLAIPSSGIALAQAPPGNEIKLVNAERDFVERKGGGEFVARPVFDRQLETLFYAVRDADTGDWITAMYRVKGGEKKRSDGWEYSWEYPALDEQPDLDRDTAYLLVMLAGTSDRVAERLLYAVVPIHQPGKIWDKVLAALSPARWAKAFAGWVIEGVHGTLCGVVERASGEDADNCGRTSVADERHPHRHPSRPHLRPRPGAPGMDGRLGHHVGRPHRDPRVDGALASSWPSTWAASRRVGGRWSPAWCSASSPPRRRSGGAP